MIRLFLSAIVAFGLGAGGAVAAEWKKLVAPAELSALVEDGGVTVLDIRSPEAYAEGHVPGALNAPYGTWRGPPENPGEPLTDAALTERLQSLGIEPDDRVVVTYEGANPTDFGAAARVYWTLKSAGLEQMAILNGGVSAWADAGQALSTEPAVAERSDATYALSEKWRVTRDEVEKAIRGERKAALVDGRPPEFWKGETKHPAAAAPGTLRGSANLPHSNWFQGSDRELTVVEKARELAREQAPAADGGEIVSFCNTGHWAATNWFALSELAGLEDVKLYPESMVGWTRDGGEAVPGQ